MRSSTLRVLRKGKSPLPQRPIPKTKSNSKTKTAETNIAGGIHTGGTSNRDNAPPEEFKAAAQGVRGEFGTWSVNEADTTVARHYEGALLPN
jgi:hypothetical protein